MALRGVAGSPIRKGVGGMGVLPARGGSKGTGESDSDDEDDEYDSEGSEDGYTDKNKWVGSAKTQPKGGNGHSSAVPEPLPLMSFQADEPDKTINIFGKELRAIMNRFLDPHVPGGDPLHDPIRSQRLAKWFAARSQREALIRHHELSGHSDSLRASRSSDVLDSLGEDLPSSSGFEKEKGSARSSSPVGAIKSVIVYDSRMDTDQDPDDVPDAASGLGTELSSQLQVLRESSLTFDADFESGNLEQAVRVEGRDSILTTRDIEQLQQYEQPEAVSHEYDLTIRKDLNTNGNIQWYYFSATAPADAQYPLRVRFLITNMQKKDALYNYGMRPAFMSEKDQASGWRHMGEDVCYFKNGSVAQKSTASTSASGAAGAGNVEGEEKKKPKRKRVRCTLCFTYTFAGPDTVYFAHAYPYTYSDLQQYLLSLEKDERYSKYMYRKLLCTTLLGNRCDLLTISSRAVDLEDSVNRPAVVVSARVHPGETNSSYAMHGVIEFLLSDCPEAATLRDNFVFKLIPMLNPDGVIHGNYRTSLVGTDLNRRYGDASARLHPTITALRGLLQSTHQRRGVLLYLDLHGHSKKKNAFLYGCDITQQPEKLLKSSGGLPSPAEVAAQRVFVRAFPSVLCALSATKEPVCVLYRSTGAKSENLFSNSSTSSHTVQAWSGDEAPEVVTGGGYFSFRDCSFSVSKSKLGTGRVVSWRNLGIEGAYTVEISFCSSGHNGEQNLLGAYGDKIVARSGAKGALGGLASHTLKRSLSIDRGDFELPSCRGAGSLGGLDAVYSSTSGNSTPRKLFERDAPLTVVGNGAVPSEAHSGSVSPRHKGLEALEKLLALYKVTSHYSKRDLQNIGRELMLAIMHFANLSTSPAAGAGSASKAAQDEPQASTSSVSATADMKDLFDDQDQPLQSGAAGAARTMLPIGADAARLPLAAAGLASSMKDAGPSVLSNPSLQRGLFSGEALIAALQTPPVEVPGSRPPESGTSDSAGGLSSKLTLNLRLKCELEVRRALQLDCSAPVLSSVASASSIGALGASEGTADQADPWGFIDAAGLSASNDKGDESADGSDSEPSVDNIPTSVMLKQVGKATDSTGALCTALRRGLERRRAKEAKEARLQEKLETARRQQQQQKILQQQAERAALAAAKAKQASTQMKKTYSVRHHRVAKPLVKYVPHYKLADNRGGAVSPILMQISSLDVNRHAAAHAAQAAVGSPPAASSAGSSSPLLRPIAVRPRDPASAPDSPLSPPGPTASAQVMVGALASPSDFKDARTAAENAKASSTMRVIRALNLARGGNLAGGVAVTTNTHQLRAAAGGSPNSSVQSDLASYMARMSPSIASPKLVTKELREGSELNEFDAASLNLGGATVATALSDGAPVVVPASSSMKKAPSQIRGVITRQLSEPRLEPLSSKESLG